MITLSTFLLILFQPYEHLESPFWKRHTIDNSSKGADGVRLADVNGDGLMDIATAWEEGGIIRVYINPGPDKATETWKHMTVGRVNSPEDAVFIDLDQDGNIDVVSSCEGKTRTLFVHWAPKNPDDYLDESQWITEAIPATENRQMWMYGLPMQVDRKNGTDLVVGSKGQNATVSWLECPENPRDLAAWKLHPIYKAGWIMSIHAHDMDRDGLLDIVLSDRKGKTKGCKWLKHPGDDALQTQPWAPHPIGGADVENMFIDIADLDEDSLPDVVSAVYTKQIIWMKCSSIYTVPHWEIHPITIPETTGIGKAARIVDIDLDGKMDIVFTSEKAEHYGVMWLSYESSPYQRSWIHHPISDPEGYKFDRIEMIDMDHDGDLDLLTCEERDNLGVIWYENPTLP